MHVNTMLYEHDNHYIGTTTVLFCKEHFVINAASSFKSSSVLLLELNCKVNFYLFKVCMCVFQSGVTGRHHSSDWAEENSADKCRKTRPARFHSRVDIRSGEFDMPVWHTNTHTHTYSMKHIWEWLTYVCVFRATGNWALRTSGSVCWRWWSRLQILSLSVCSSCCCYSNRIQTLSWRSCRK